MIELPEHIQSKIQPEPNTGCWLWVGMRTVDGYGHLWIGEEKKTKRAHRVVYAFYKGEIPEGLELDHKCRVRCCVNPDHLEAVTHQENMLRGEGFASGNALKTICCNGHSLHDAYVFRNRIGGLYRRCRECHAAYDRAYYRRTAIKGETSP